jgi:hypothetical protein
MVSLAPTAQGKDTPEPAPHSNARVHRDAGDPLSGKSNETPAARVKAYLKGRGLSDVTVGSLVGVGGVWKSRGVGHLRMEQQVAGMRVHDTYARAAFDKSGRLIDLIENVAAVPKGPPHAATIDDADALRAAARDLYPGRSVDARTTGRSKNTTRFAKDGWYAEPTVERVALPTTENELAVGYVVTTWTADDNELYETVVSGDGEVVETIRRTAEEGYHVFPEDPDKGDQEPRAGTPDWLLAGAQQSSQYIRGNYANAYIDADADNAPDGGGSPVNDGLFDSIFDESIKPSESQNRDVSVQNLFYLNSLIHDTLYAAGFDEAAGNFQETNPRREGRGGDPVAAEAQDGSGTDNANFATPRDGQDPRMQMYLWSVPGMYQVVVPEGPAADVYDAANAEWTDVDATGVTAPMAVAVDGLDNAPDDAQDNTTDACEPITSDVAGKIAIADRGLCPFIDKAANAQAAGAVGLIIANNAEGAPFPMGGADASVTLPALMVNMADGAMLKQGAGSEATLKRNDDAIMRDSALDSDVVWHEYGHGLTWRMIGRMDGPIAGAIGEGMSDVLALIANNDDRVGEYSASDPIGIRSEPYSGYSRTYGDIAGTGVHLDGEVYGAIGWDLLQAYRDAHGEDGNSLLLGDLVDGMNYTPAQPSYEEMRDGILAGLANSADTDDDARTCTVWDSFAAFGVGVGAKGVVRGKKLQITESFESPSECGTTSP